MLTICRRITQGYVGMNSKWMRTSGPMAVLPSTSVTVITALVNTFSTRIFVSTQCVQNHYDVNGNAGPCRTAWRSWVVWAW